ncbi:MAG: helix-turn-helix domain-containing protein [Novosphingobium sp.]|jgi:DNA-binding IclR family transcriptional regulator|nr:helix-turn-helix domain-containing protein [Novosphingobium sp.]
MSRSSPGVRRVASILNFIADHPGQAFALTDLVRALKLSRATCHALLTGLVDVGYLYRTSDKTYVLGPALAAIGRTAAGHFSPLQVAQPEMRSLADEFDVVCTAYFLEGDTMHLRDRAASASHVGYPVPLGTRMRLRSAQAGVYFAWSPQDAEDWLQATSPRPSAERRELMFQTMDFVRQNGFSPLIRRPGFGFTGAEMPSSDIGADSDELPVQPIVEVDEGRVYPIGALMAPIPDGRGKVIFALVMAGFHSPMTGAQVMAVGHRLANACERISAFVTGRDTRARAEA